MAKKQFKTESKKLLDMMINSIYTHKEIFLRELISNGSDAIDKLYYRSLTDSSVTLKREDYEIRLTPDADRRTITVSDNGIGMTKEELDNNLGVIARSGSLDFKKNADVQDNAEIIGQFGVGFYSAFMVAKKITVTTRPFGSDEAWKWVSEGADGYTITEAHKDSFGTDIVLELLDDTEDEKYSEYLDTYKLRSLVKKYSDYIRYPIRMFTDEYRPVEDAPEGEPKYETVKELTTLNSMVPLWRRSPSDISEEEYRTFYREKFYDYEQPVKVIHFEAEGLTSFRALLFIPAKAPYDYYTKNFEKGLQLYSNGVLIMDKCKDLLPDYFGFVRGLIDSPDLSLNISRELLQHDRQLKRIAKSVEKKIKSELIKLMTEDRAAYEKFFDAFGLQLKYGVYADFGVNREALQDLLIFRSDKDGSFVSLKEYAERMKEGQKAIYYACGETYDAAAMLPQAEAVTARGFEVLYLKDDVDEFALRVLTDNGGYMEHPFMNVCDESLDITTDEEKEAIKQENEGAADLLTFMKDTLEDGVSAVKFTTALKDHPVCLTTEGALSLEMEKVLSSMPGSDGSAKAETVLSINLNHPIAAKLKSLFEEDKDKLADYTKVLYAQARLIGGMTVDNPTELASLVCSLMV